MSENLYDTGLSIRKAVVGERYVEASLADADAFTLDFQRLTKHSGYGREHTLETLREWTYTKTLRLPFGEGDIPQWDALSDVLSPV
jgi:hypothetical protein